MKTIAIIALIIGTLFFLLGLVFKIMHWPASIVGISVGLVLTVIGLVIFIISQTRNNKD